LPPPPCSTPSQAAAAADRAAVARRYPRAAAPYSPCGRSDGACHELEGVVQNALGFPRLPPRLHRALSEGRLTAWAGRRHAASAEHLAAAYGRELALVYVNRAPRLLEQAPAELSARAEALARLLQLPAAAAPGAGGPGGAGGAPLSPAAAAAAGRAPAAAATAASSSASAAPPPLPPPPPPPPPPLLPALLRKCPELLAQPAEVTRLNYASFSRALAQPPLAFGAQRCRAVATKYPVALAKPPAAVARAVAALRRLCGAREAWSRDLADATPSLVAFFLADAGGALRRLEFLSATGGGRALTLREVLKPGDAGFARRHPQFPRWLKAVRARRDALRAAALRAELQQQQPQAADAASPSSGAAAASAASSFSTGDDDDDEDDEGDFGSSLRAMEDEPGGGRLGGGGGGGGEPSGRRRVPAARFDESMLS